MDITPLIGSDQKVIQSYNTGKFRISGDLFDHAVFVFPDKVIKWDISNDVDVGAITENDFRQIVGESDNLDVVLFGSGRTADFINPSICADLKAKNIVIESMDTGAACRTYNVLMAEGRRVAAALLPF